MALPRYNFLLYIYELLLIIGENGDVETLNNKNRYTLDISR